jgi:hypothetical protein
MPRQGLGPVIVSDWVYRQVGDGPGCCEDDVNHSINGVTIVSCLLATYGSSYILPVGSRWCR